MNRENLDRVIEAMREEQVEQMLVCDPASVNYLLGRYIECGERMMVLCLDTNGKHKLVIGKLFPQNEAVGVPVVYFDDTENPVEILTAQMRKTERIGVDKTWPARFLLPCMKQFPEAEFMEASFLVDRIRQIKSKEEQQKMIEASRRNDLAMEQLVPLVAKGYSEVEVCEKLTEIYQNLGTEGHSFEPIIGYGDNGANPHHSIDGSHGKTGDCVVLDVGCRLNGYCADMTRTVFIGEVSEEARKIYEIVKEANRRGREAVKPGVRFCDIDAAARDYIAEQGYGEYFTHRLGHNIGMEVHEWGDVSASNKEVVKPGMCFSIEPGIYMPGVAGVRIEDLVLVTEDGCRVLNDYSRDLIVVPED